MTIKNTDKVSKIKKVFYLVSIALALAILGLFLLDHVIYALSGIGVFSLWYLYFHVADYQYIEFSDEDGKIVFRFYKVISFGGKAYNSIEFPKNTLRKALFESSFFGKLTDVTLVIRTQRGIAEYPPISLVGLNVEDRIRIQESLNAIIKK